jgi:AraC-like DNA-binding protein
MSSPARILFRNGSFALGEFRCRPDDVRWRAVNVMSGCAHVVFPRTSVVIQQDGHEPVLANQNHVMFYDRDRRYRRELHDPRGDHCAFVALAPELVASLREAAEVAAPAESRLPFIQGPSDAQTYLSLFLAVRALRQGKAERVAVEELVYDALFRSVDVAVDVHDRRRRAKRRHTDHGHFQLVEEAKRLLTERAAHHDSLEWIARTLHTSPFHLSRMFRDRTGFTLHRYRIHIRLRLAVERLSAGESDLGALARELGFHSHSHFTGVFGSVFGLPPSEVRGELSVRGRRGAPAQRPEWVARPSR